MHVQLRMKCPCIPAWQRLSQCVEQELALEQRALAGLPALAGFEVETSGTSAILRRTLEGGTAYVQHQTHRLLPVHILSPLPSPQH